MSSLVFVDFAGKGENKRPDFYVLTPEDWRQFIEDRVSEFGGSRGRIEISDENVPVWLDQVKNGKPYQGMGVLPKQIQEHQEAWDKIRQAVSST